MNEDKKTNNQEENSQPRCKCGQLIETSWNYCCNCGVSLNKGYLDTAEKVIDYVLHL